MSMNQKRDLSLGRTYAKRLEQELKTAFEGGGVRLEKRFQLLPASGGRRRRTDVGHGQVSSCRVRDNLYAPVSEQIAKPEPMVDARICEHSGNPNATGSRGQSSRLYPGFLAKVD